MFSKFHVAILLSQNCTSRRKGRQGLIDHLGVVDDVATEPELGYNAVKLGVECEEIWKIHHAEADPVALSLRQKIGFFVLES